MSKGDITEYRGRPGAITAWEARTRLEAPLAHLDWSTFGSPTGVASIAAAAASDPMWLATRAGVVAWSPAAPDTYSVYKSEHGLLSNAISSVCATGPATAWAGHRDGGLSRFVDGTWRPVELLADEPIRALAPGTASVWVATASGVYQIDTRGRLLTVAIDHIGANDACALLEDGDGVLLGNLCGVFRLRVGAEPQQLARDDLTACIALARDATGSVWLANTRAVHLLRDDVVVERHAPAGDDPEQRILAIACASDRVWVLTTAGLVEFSQGRWRSVEQDPLQASPPRLLALASSKDRDYAWLGTDGGLAGVHIGNPPIWDASVVSPARALPNFARCVQMTQTGIVIGTCEGLARQSEREWIIYPDAGDVRRLVAGADGDVWLLSWPHGVGRLGHGVQHDFRLPQPPGIPVALTWGDGTGHVLAGRRVYRIDADQARPVGGVIPQRASDCVLAPDGSWWAATLRGAFRLATDEWLLAGEQPGPLDGEVHALLATDAGVWVATATGLWQRVEEGWTLHDVPHDVRVMAGGTGDRLWLAGSAGLALYDPSSRMIERQFSRHDSGLATRRISALLEADGALWVVGHGGTSRLVL